MVVIMICLDTNIFLLLFDNEDACDFSHMTCHMIWDHRPRL